VALSILTDVQTGPAIVGLFGVLFLIAFAFSPVYGLMALALKRFHLKGED